MTADKAIKQVISGSWPCRKTFSCQFSVIHFNEPFKVGGGASPLDYWGAFCGTPARVGNTKLKLYDRN